MRIFPLFVLAALALVCPAAVPTFERFEPTQFDTNGLIIKYRADWTNEVGTIRPATVNTEVTLTNLNIYETLVLPAKVFALSLGTNELNVSTNTSWLLSSPTNDAAQVILSLSSGKFQGQLLLITSQNDTGAFTLPDGSEQYDVPGALVDLQGDWIATTNRGILLQYTAPDWIEMNRFNPAAPAPEGFTTGAGITNINQVVSGNYTPGSGVTFTTNANGAVSIASSASGGDTIWTNISGTIQPISGQVTNRLSFTSGAADNATNVAVRIDSATQWQSGTLLSIGSATPGHHSVVSIIRTNTGSGGLVDDPVGLYINLRNDAFVENSSFGALIENLLPTVESGGSLLYGSQYARGLQSAVSYVDFSGTNYGQGVGVFGIGSGTYGVQYGVIGAAYGGVNSQTNIGGAFSASNYSGTNTVTVGAYVEAADNDNSPPFLENAVLLLDNRDLGVPLIVGRTANGTTRVVVQHDGSISLSSQTNRLGISSGNLQLDGINIGNTNITITQTNLSVKGNLNVHNIVFTNSIIGPMPVWQGMAASDETTALTTTTNAVRVQFPFAFTLTGVYASVTTPQTSGSVLTIDLKENGTSVLSTLMTIDNNEYGTDTATPAVISDSAIAQYAPLVFSITQVGTSPKGLKVWVKGTWVP